MIKYDVFFDNLQVTHNRGPILEETHYYPFGLVMSGISSKALNNSPANKYKYNGIEQNSDFDLNVYDAFYRNLDPQIGRFWQIDPKPNEVMSLYAAMNNNPICFSDFLGDTAIIDKASLTTQYQQNGKTVTGAQLGQQMVEDWESVSGLNLSFNTETGEIKEVGVATNTEYSKFARNLVRRILGVGGKTTYKFSQDEDSGVDKPGSKIVVLGVNEIEGFVSNTPTEIASTTLGYGMTALHEWYHTKHGGSFGHNDAILPTSHKYLLDKPDIEVNKIRTEMTVATGINYAQRGSYTGVWWCDANGRNGKNYLPLGILFPQQYEQMKEASRKKILHCCLVSLFLFGQCLIINT